MFPWTVFPCRAAVKDQQQKEDIFIPKRRNKNLVLYAQEEQLQQTKPVSLWMFAVLIALNMQ